MKLIKKRPIGDLGYIEVKKELDIIKLDPKKKKGVKYVFDEEDINSLNTLIRSLEKKYLTSKDDDLIYKINKNLHMKEQKSARSALLKLLPRIKRLSAKIEKRKNTPNWYEKNKVY
ncbi:MAG: hypothetical protein NTY12_05075 [Candidatus Falkowbacteria bacterium]|nr:hypothetical protein [Candidatus Falkowbacteria bacterium]